ncbi:hypothetical protein ICV01_06250 [Polynucleobacter sp. MWH-Spelu-300-X4]|uniref:hypothetical protein n=1 Tax=Polynucleobacter sp. MWH-Spelu-300-X4 TaxID=2689109 RepID=UPI001BFE7B0C|nr:hypothetical protein [Polynucleobacter sp. MWH-Spelu-300-X4]QWD79249.1 hypothetical protein ICV01_06250 [Polynucleobacter sp. MWH-Spelu-300-X4]
MNKYLVSIRIKGQVVRTTIEADSSIHARLIAEWHFGIGSVASPPTKLKETSISTPQTLEKARVKSLQAQADRAKQAVKAEKARQTIAKAQEQMRTPANS